MSFDDCDDIHDPGILDHFREPGRNEPYRALGPGMRPLSELPRACLGDIYVMNDRHGHTRIVRIEQANGLGTRAFYTCDGDPFDGVEWREPNDLERDGFETYVAERGRK